MGLFGKLGKAPPPGGGGRYMNDGQYLVEITKVTAGESQKGEGPFVAVEATILEVISEYDNSNKVGESVSWVVMFKHPPAMSNLRGFFAAACGIHVEAQFFQNPTDPDAIVMVAPGEEIPKDARGRDWPDVSDREWEAAAEKAVSGAGTTLAGIELIADAVTIRTKKGNPFTKVRWWGVGEEDPEAAQSA
jgi:hypothetical protein